MNMIQPVQEQAVFLSLDIRKGNYQTDAEGNFFFDVEASNENLDLEQQAVLQSALLTSKDYFLSNGIVSKDHLHKRVENGQQLTDEEYIIGEPVAVYTDGTSTRVTGKLYRNNKHAKKFIDLLESGSTRVKASVGGILPKVVKKNGTEQVVSVLWNDLALTVAPVNYTVSAATGIGKSLSSLEFVKSLTAGYGTDAALFTGGRALQNEEAGLETAVAGLIGALLEGRVHDIEEAKAFLKGYGFSDARALDVIGELADQHTEFEEVLTMAKGSLFDGIINRLTKSMGGGKGEPEKDEGEQGEEEAVDATEVIKSLANEIEDLRTGQEALAKALSEQSGQEAEFRKSMGEGMIALLQGQQAIAETPLPRKGLGSLPPPAGGTPKHRPFTAADIGGAREALSKALAAKQISLAEYSLADMQITKSIQHPAFQIDKKFLDIVKGGITNE